MVKETATNDLLDECIRFKEQNDYLSKHWASVAHELFNDKVQSSSPHRPLSIGEVYFRFVDRSIRFYK